MPSGIQKSVDYGSWTLSQAESSNVLVDKEALVVIFTIKICDRFLEIISPVRDITTEIKL